ncbi:Lar family protein [Erwinia phage vB_EhrS_49]|uniref:Lar family protein n=1 Tax=Erwinia phage vB_EhrS_49 TaxID=2283026 RepID=A0A4Y1NRB1_9CAUD|nr:Lar-like restriction alleviation protein [Erwinia phage vB_EhrS_49]AXH43507.1 Lar family protein [Erwinia phage vB_EhrS_49]
MTEELKPCPFCGGSAKIESNRDWHTLYVDHAINCIIEDCTPQYSSSTENYGLMVKDWNTRAEMEKSDD